MCSGLMHGVFAYVVHAILADAWRECVRLLSVAAISGLWRTFLKFGYMAHPRDDARKYGIYGGFTGLLQQVWGKWIAPREKKLQLFISKVAPPYLLRITFGKCLSGNGSESAKAAGPPDEAADTQTVGGTGSVGWSVQAGEEWRLVAHSLGRGLRP